MKKTLFTTFIILLIIKSITNVFHEEEKNEKLSAITIVMEPKIEKTMYDSVQNKYKDYCDLYLKRDIFKGTPMNGELLAKYAIEVYKETGILVPMELALAQGQLESHMGTTGLSKRTNPYNVGEWDNKTVKKFNSIDEGVYAYYKLIANDYLKYRNLSMLRKSFKNKDGNRYASYEHYERELFKQYDYIKSKKWIKTN